MKFDIIDILKLLGALGFFIYGMKVMSDSIQKAAGNRMRKILGAMTKNRFFGVLTGFLVTGLVQSSSATTVMTVSFVNAGLLSLVESAGVMMGANIGTTITGWLVSYLGFKFKIVSLALPIIAFGMPLMFTKRSNLRFWGEFMIGFALLFMGLETLKNSVPDFHNQEHHFSFLSNYADASILSTILFVGVGALLTIVIQSSSAAMTLTFVMCYNGWIPFSIATAMVLGENIGTTITAEIASLVGNIHAKRSARIHSLFNIIGVTWMVLALPIFLDLVSWISVEYLNNPSPFDNVHAIPDALALFHTIFNLSNVLLLIWFVPYIVALAKKTLPSKKGSDELFHLEYIGSGLMGTPEMSVHEAGKEVVKFGELVKKMSTFFPPMLTQADNKEFNKSMERIAKYEEITDRMEVEIANYLGKVSEGELSQNASLKMRGMLSIINDFERIGDIYFQMSKILERKRKNKIWFTPDQRSNLMSMFQLLNNAFINMIKLLSDLSIDEFTKKSNEIKHEINSMRNQLRKENLIKMEKAEYSFESGVIYNDLFSSCERIGDHIYNINEAFVGKV